MASAQLMEEQLQRSVMVSEDEAEYEKDEAPSRLHDQNDASQYANSEIAVNEPSHDSAEDSDTNMVDGEETANSVGDGREDGSQESGDEDAAGEDDDAFEEDAEGEDDEDVPSDNLTIRNGSIAKNADEESEQASEAEDDDEGVGAVKIKPGETDEEEDDADADASEDLESHSGSEEDSEDAAAWEEAAENEIEDDESEAATGANCMFCKQSEENDPSDEFESYLACSGCGEHAHQQCARDANALSTDKDEDKNWICPDCVGEDIELPTQEEPAVEGSSTPELTPTARRTSAQKLTRDLLPSQRGDIKPDSHSVFDQLIVNGDPLDGSRHLRKRKTSSAEADEHISVLRKRRRTTSDSRKSPEDGEEPDTRSGPDAPTRPSSSRTLRPKDPKVSKVPARLPLATVLKQTRVVFQMKFKVEPAELQKVLDASNRRRARRGSSSRVARPHSAVPTRPALIPPFISTPFSQPFYSLLDKETDEMKGKPYGGILDEAEADTSKTFPSTDDRRRFDEAKQKAENQWRERIEEMQAQLVDLPVRKAKKSSGPASQIECIEFGGWEIDTWYAAPYPEEYSRNRVLYICEFCLKYMNSDYVAWRHKLKCPAKHPPGDEIYRKGSVSMFEVDGRKNPVYCQNLCLLAKLFLGSKTLYYDVEPFLFYVLCESDDLGYHFVGYFSKEKRASSQNNVSCILTLPIHQRKGYGNLLVDFSYLLTRIEQKTGSPEKPLSDMGLVSYRNYWRLIMCRYLVDHEDAAEDKTKKGLSIRKISDDTGLTPDDVISALEGLRCLVRDPQTGLYAFRVDLTYCREYVGKWDAKNYVKLDPACLTWTPYVMGRSNATNFELGPAITAIAPREEDDEKAQLLSEVVTNGAAATPAADMEDNTIEVTVMETTEEADPAEAADGSNGANGADGDKSATPDGDEGDESAEPQANGSQEAEPAVEAAQETAEDEADDWSKAYEGIPLTRFQIFPSINATRRADRPKSTAVRPPASAGSSARPRRPTGTSAPKPKKSSSSSSSKRKPGGTGRGPGRWPKGTKKSDYGGASSGPGLPPAWIERNRLAAQVVTDSRAKVATANGKAVRAVDMVEAKVDLLVGGVQDASGGNAKSAEDDESSSVSDN